LNATGTRRQNAFGRRLGVLTRSRGAHISLTAGRSGEARERPAARGDGLQFADGAAMTDRTTPGSAHIANFFVPVGREHIRSLLQ
jgi:hypothetical protein